MSETIWVMDSECCSKCGALLDYFETYLCFDCEQDEIWQEQHIYDDPWWEHTWSEGDEDED